MSFIRRTILAITPAAMLGLIFASLQLKVCFSFSNSRIERETRIPLRKNYAKRKSWISEDETSNLLSESTASSKILDLPPTSSIMSRRHAALSIASIIPLIPLSASAKPASESLQDLELGHGEWTKLGRATASATLQSKTQVPPSFATYMSHFLIRYDRGVYSWWQALNRSYSLISESQRLDRLKVQFGSLAASVQNAVDTFLRQQDYDHLARLLLEKYDSDTDAKRHIGILFSLLPSNLQPVEILRELTKNAGAKPNSGRVLSLESTSFNSSTPPPPKGVVAGLGSLLPAEYHCIPVNKACTIFAIFPSVDVYEVTIDEEFGQTTIGTTFGPLSSLSLTREIPDYPLDIYALFGISGATGCALTHAIVIPLDVVKTRAQTDPEQYKNLVAGAARILHQEGFPGLLTGAQATIAGYFWYGLSVYPSYTFFKRYLGTSVLPPELAAIHTNDIALLAGAMAAVIASLGLTPIEAARIRVVSEPERYKPLGLAGTIGAIAREDTQLGWKALYAGLPSLMARQVIFGSVKFLAFERACEAIFAAWPFLRDATWTALTVSLVAGGISGALSSVVSQPADSVLTYVAKKQGGKKGNLGVIDGCLLMVEEEGISSLFRGLGSRCVWAGSIIAGQFLLYDVFRTYFGVSAQDLSQVFQITILRNTG